MYKIMLKKHQLFLLSELQHVINNDTRKIRRSRCKCSPRGGDCFLFSFTKRTSAGINSLSFILCRVFCTGNI